MYLVSSLLVVLQLHLLWKINTHLYIFLYVYWKYTNCCMHPSTLLRSLTKLFRQTSSALCLFFFYHCKVCVGVLCLQKVKVMTHHSSTRLSCCFTTSSSKTQVVGVFFKSFTLKNVILYPQDPENNDLHSGAPIICPGYFYSVSLNRDL